MRRILLDENLPFGLVRLLGAYQARHAIQEGWDGLANGRLLAAAESRGFDGLVTADKNLRYQQNLAGRRIGVLVLSSNYWPLIRNRAEAIGDALQDLKAGDVTELDLGAR